MSEQSSKEVKILLDLIPPRGVDVSVRKDLNQKIRELLPSISNDAIFELALCHHLSFLELRNRINQDKIQDLSELFRLIETLFLIQGKAANDLFKGVCRRVVISSHYSNAIEISELLRDYAESRIEDDLLLCSGILMLRRDLDEISELINSYELPESTSIKLNRIIKEAMG